MHDHYLILYTNVTSNTLHCSTYALSGEQQDVVQHSLHCSTYALSGEQQDVVQHSLHCRVLVEGLAMYCPSVMSMPGLKHASAVPCHVTTTRIRAAWLTGNAYHTGCKAPVLKCQCVAMTCRHPLPSVPRALASAAWQPTGPRQPTCDPYAGDHALAEGGGSGDSATPPSLILSRCALQECYVSMCVCQDSKCPQ